MGQRASAEDRFFRNEEAVRQRIEAWDRLQQNARSSRAEQARAKALQQRHCPKCHVALELLTLRGVEIDRCSLCKGVWLDEGELEQLCRPATGVIARLAALFRRPG